jgi:serine/threonine protein phosphatase 1
LIDDGEKVKRLIAVGDIHGHRDLLTDLINQVQPTNQDHLVFLGDYIDRGPDSKGVIDDLLDIQKRFPQTIFLRGNHEQMMLDTLVDLGILQGGRLEDWDRDWSWESRNTTSAAIWGGNGGAETLKSYGAKIERDQENFWGHILSGEIPQEHIVFLEETRLNYRYENFLFAHAHYTDLDDPYTLLWGCDGRWRWRPRPKKDEEIMVLGHMVIDEVEERGGYLYVDTGAGWGEHLSGVDVLTGHVYQAFPAKDPNRKPRILGGIEYYDD